jgi:tetratricopeptide (TPR) repeat protein
LTRGFPAGLLLTICAAGIAAAPQQGQSAREASFAREQQLDASPALFSVLAAINAGGFDADLDSPSNSPLRAMVRAAIAAKAPPILAEMKRFVAAHHHNDAAQELSQYISFALCVDGPPDFAWRYRVEDLPPDVVPLEGLRQLMVRFHQEGGIDQLWQKAQPAFEQAIARYHAPASAALTQVNAYLRASTSGPINAHFQIYVDLLGPPNQVHTRSFRNDYFVVVTPSAEPQAEAVRHAYLHFMLDPLAVRYGAELDKKQALISYAQNAPLLEDYYKTDFHRLATECLIKAVEARLDPAASRQTVVDAALREGYILVPAFFDALPAYEKQEQSLHFYYPDLVAAIDVKREGKRLQQVEFASTMPVRKAKPATLERPPELTGVYKTLDEAERYYSANPRQLDRARAAYLQALKETEIRALQARAYYGLAKIAALERDPETAEGLFKKTLESEPDPQVKAWAHIYLGRLADAAGEREQATGHYRSALGVQGASDQARKAAEDGLARAFERR